MSILRLHEEENLIFFLNFIIDQAIEEQKKTKKQKKCINVCIYTDTLLDILIMNRQLYRYIPVYVGD